MRKVKKCNEMLHIVSKVYHFDTNLGILKQKGQNNAKFNTIFEELVKNFFQNFFLINSQTHFYPKTPFLSLIPMEYFYLKYHFILRL